MLVLERNATAFSIPPLDATLDASMCWKRDPRLKIEHEDEREHEESNGGDAPNRRAKPRRLGSVLAKQINRRDKPVGPGGVFRSSGSLAPPKVVLKPHQIWGYRVILRAQ